MHGTIHRLLHVTDIQNYSMYCRCIYFSINYEYKTKMKTRMKKGEVIT